MYRGQPFLIERHLARLIDGATAVGIAPLPTASALASTVRDLIDRNEIAEALVRTTVTRGVSTGWDARHAGDPTVVIVEQPFAGYPDQLYRSGASIVILANTRLRPSALTPSAKSLSLLAHVQAKRDATDHGADEAVLCTESGSVAEGTVSNVFCVKNGRLHTPPLSDGILQGITREVVLGLARRDKIETVEDRVTPDELRTADEVFLTSTGMEVMPVTRADGRPVGTGHPGPITLALRRGYQEMVRETLESRTL